MNLFTDYIMFRLSLANLNLNRILNSSCVNDTVYVFYRHIFETVDNYCIRNVMYSINRPT